MKRLFLAMLLACAGMPAYADSISEIEQISPSQGTAKKAVVAQKKGMDPSIGGRVPQGDPIGTGNMTHIAIEQAMTPAESGSASLVEMFGNDNSAAIDQSGVWGNNASTVVVTGGGNTVDVGQTAIDASGAQRPRNTSQIQIGGASNQVAVSQSADIAGRDLPGSNNSAVTILGTGGTVSVLQSLQQ